MKYYLFVLLVIFYQFCTCALKQEPKDQITYQNNDNLSNYDSIFSCGTLLDFIVSKSPIILHGIVIKGINGIGIDAGWTDFIAKIVVIDIYKGSNINDTIMAAFPRPAIMDGIKKNKLFKNTSELNTYLRSILTKTPKDIVNSDTIGKSYLLNKGADVLLFLKPDSNSTITDSGKVYTVKAPVDIWFSVLPYSTQLEWFLKKRLNN